MRIRAGIVFIEDDSVALIERYRDGKHYFVFPGGGADKDETPEQAAVREMKEETGLQVIVKKLVAVIRFELSTQYCYLAKYTSGKYGTGEGEEYTDADPDDPVEGIYIPIWMPIEDLSVHESIYPVEIKEFVLKSRSSGWPDEPVVIVEPMK